MLDATRRHDISRMALLGLSKHGENLTTEESVYWDRMVAMYKDMRAKGQVPDLTFEWPEL